MQAETRMIPNTASPEGRELGREMARICDAEIGDGPDDRCATCAFRAGDHLANGSVATLMTALKCAMEREPFWCHEADNRPCAGWQAVKAAKGGEIAVPWECLEGADVDA